MKIILAALVFAAAITGQAYDADMMEDQLEASGAHAIEDALPDDARDIMDELGLELTYDGANGANADSAIETIADMAIQSSKRPLRVCISALGIVVLCALARTITDKDENSLSTSFDTISSCAAVLTVCVPAGEIIDLAAEGIGNSCSFGAVLVPVLAGLTAVSGRAAGASAYSAFTLSVIETVNVLTSTVIVPGLRILFALSVVGALSSTFDISKLISSVEKYCKWLLGFIAVLLSGVLSMSVVAASAADNTATRAGRFVISGTVPVVGGVISEAIGTVLNCIGIVKNSVGAFGLAAAMIIVLPFVITAAAWVVCLNCTAWASEALGAGRPASALRSIASVLSFSLGLTAFTAMVLICSTAMILMMRGV